MYKRAAKNCNLKVNGQIDIATNLFPLLEIRIEEVTPTTENNWLKLNSNLYKANFFFKIILININNCHHDVSGGGIHFIPVSTSFVLLP